MQRQVFEYHPVIGYRFIPGLKARIPHESGGYLVRVNNYGFRCEHEFTVKKAAKHRRILLFGDSFTAGDGVSNGKRFGDLLEKEIPDLEVYNFGLSGTGTDQQYLAYREYAAEMECDLLVVAVLVENIRRITARFRYYYNELGEAVCYPKPYYELLGDRLVLKNVPVSPAPVAEEELPGEEKRRIDQGGRFALLRRLIVKAGLKEFAQRATRYQPLPEYDSPQNLAWLLMRTILKQWIAGHNGPVLLVPVPLYQYIEETGDSSRYRARFRELAEETGCELHDPLPDMLSYPEEERRRFRFTKDVHMTPLGHRALALSLKKTVSKLL